MALAVLAVAAVVRDIWACFQGDQRRPETGGVEFAVALSPHLLLQKGRQSKGQYMHEMAHGRMPTKLRETSIGIGNAETTMK